ncbi:MAG: hypothetical protein AAF909_15470 [Pseudomonadota bacterium]
MTLLALASALAQEPRPYVRPPDPFFMRDFVIEYFFETELREGTASLGALADQMNKLRGVGCEYIPMLTDGLPFVEEKNGPDVVHVLELKEAHVALSCTERDAIFSNFVYRKNRR